MELTLEVLLRYVEWDTINDMIEQLTRSIDYDRRWQRRGDPTIVEARDAMMAYMQREWPDHVREGVQPLALFIDDLAGNEVQFDLAEVGAVYPDDGVIYIAGAPCRLSSARWISHPREA